MSSRTGSSRLSIEQLVLHIREGECACPSTGAKETISKLGVTQLRELFMALKGERQRAGPLINRFDYRIRKHLGIWYATAFLACIPLEAAGVLTLDDRLRALARECLQWHADAFLSHVLVYYRDPHNEQMELCTVAAAPNRPCVDTRSYQTQFDCFLQKFQEYVAQEGSTVRGDYYLEYRLKTRGLLEESAELEKAEEPVDPQKEFWEGLYQHDTISLPADPTKEGCEDLYLSRVQETLATWFPAIKEKPTLQHIAAGSDTQYGHLERNRGAVAHMYVVSARELSPSSEYLHSMREALHHLSMAYALERLHSAAEDLTKAAARERSLSKELQDRFTILSGQMLGVDDSIRAMRRLVYKGPWQAIQQWIREFRRLITDNEPFPLFSQELKGSHDGWTIEHHAAALLTLAAVTPQKDFDGCSSLAQIWTKAKAFSSQAFNNDRLLRCLGRLGLLTEERPTWWSLEILKDAFQLPFADNSASILAMLFCVGGYSIAGSPSPARLFRLANNIQLELVANGLNLLLESLLKYKSCELNQPTGLGVSLSHEQLSIQLSPVTIDGQIALADGGFQKVATNVDRKTKESSFPDRYKNETAVCSLLALGVDEARWEEMRNKVHVTNDGNNIKIGLGDADGNIAQIVYDGSTLVASYRLGEE